MINEILKRKYLLSKNTQPNNQQNQKTSINHKPLKGFFFNFTQKNATTPRRKKPETKKEDIKMNPTKQQQERNKNKL
ncbi:hypothetical protein PA0299 [Candidatus Phytoplasma australiense]|uniref:Uncharacterized protein n=1 Tax=Phytoplasma australiense TaxID=59748 RepID=B1V9L2_PHYAS|nr:hypothetical protein PA0299 [Candidatus Phytoplasma australiense]